MGDQTLHWTGVLLAAGAATAGAWFLEALFKSVFHKSAPVTMGMSGGMEGGPDAALQAASAPPSAPNSISKLNAKILENPWILEFLEKDYYGLGQRKDMEPPKMLITMEKAGVFGAILMVVFSVWLDIPINPGLIFMGFVGGFFFPHMQARKQVLERQRKALMNLPSFVDLLALTIESGLDYLTSMERIATGVVKKHGPLEEEIENVLREVQLGYPRRDALRHFSRRVDVQEVRSLVGLLIQSDELGTGLVNLLRNFSQDMRNRRIGKAEEMAGKAATKMLGPMMIFIFPVIFALILSPFAYTLVSGGGMPF